jgi:ankyrin repeat protein
MITDKFRYKENTILNYIKEHPDGVKIPDELLAAYRGEKDINIQTPLMYAVLRNNVDYVSQMLLHDVGVLDEDSKSALDHARAVRDKNNKIIELLSQYEECGGI